MTPDLIKKVEGLTGRPAGAKVPDSQMQYLRTLSSRGPRWYGICNSSLTALQRRGLAACSEMVGQSRLWRINDAGLALLRSLDARDKGDG